MFRGYFGYLVAISRDGCHMHLGKLSSGSFNGPGRSALGLTAATGLPPSG